MRGAGPQEGRLGLVEIFLQFLTPALGRKNVTSDRPMQSCSEHVNAGLSAMIQNKL